VSEQLQLVVTNPLIRSVVAAVLVAFFQWFWPATGLTTDDPVHWPTVGLSAVLTMLLYPLIAEWPYRLFRPKLKPGKTWDWIGLGFTFLLFTPLFTFLQWTVDGQFGTRKVADLLPVICLVLSPWFVAISAPSKSAS
jgi:hypothetical protein